MHFFRFVILFCFTHFEVSQLLHSFFPVFDFGTFAQHGKRLNTPSIRLRLAAQRVLDSMLILLLTDPWRRHCEVGNVAGAAHL